MRVAVTGGAGFIGAHSVRALLDAGHSVRLLVRDATDATNTLAGVGVTVTPDMLVHGDVRDPSDVARLIAGSDAMLHGAGVVGVDERRAVQMWDVNAAATADVLTQAVRAGLDPIVHVSSYSALFPSTDPVIGPQSPPTDGRSSYTRSKVAAERIARSFQDAGAPVVITYPSSVVGPPAGSRTGLTAIGWRPVLRAPVMVTFDGGVLMIDVRDVAALHAAAMQPGRGPRRYMCGGELLAFDDVLDILATAAGRRRLRRFRISAGTVRRIGRLVDLVAARIPLPPLLSVEAALLLTEMTPTDDSLALEELGLRWRSARESLLASTVVTP